MNKMKLIMKAVDQPKGERTFRSIITTPAVDRQGEVLLPQGLIATDYETNPVVFYCHDYQRYPIARCIELARKPESWEAVARVAERPEDHQGEWMPDVVYSLIKQGVLNGVSVGFLAVEQRKPTAKDIKQFGPEVSLVISKWKLLEYSVTGMPCNQEALITAVKSFSPTIRKNLGVNIDDPAPASKQPPAPEPLRVVDLSGDPVPATPGPRKHVLVIPTKRAPSDQQREQAMKKGKLWI